MKVTRIFFENSYIVALLYIRDMCPNLKRLTVNAQSAKVTAQGDLNSFIIILNYRVYSTTWRIV